MAKATITYTCKICGQTATASVTRHSRREADAWKEYAQDTYDTCPECYRTQQQEAAAIKAADALAKYNLPEITTGSQKQIDYATDLRRKYILDPDNTSTVDRVQELLGKLQHDRLANAAAKANTTPAEYLKKYMRDQMKAGTPYIALTSSNAAEIINVLK